MSRKTLTQRQPSVAVRRAQEALRTQGGDPRALYDLAQELKQENRLEFARRVLEKARDEQGKSAEPLALLIKILHDLALITYKDPDLPLDDRLKSAEQILDGLVQLRIPEETEQDCWGIRGAIHKHRWNTYGLREHLIRSRECYLKGYAMGIQMDRGYTAINAAFVIDLLASDTESQELADRYRAEAEQLRQTVIQELPPMQDRPAGENGPLLKTQWWFICTIGEAYLGLGLYNEAREWISKSKGLKRQPWQMEATARQFAHLVRLRLLREGADLNKLEAFDLGKLDPNNPPPEIASHFQAFLVLCDLLGGDPRAAVAAQSFTRGKVGLALSGGGFRASLYHIGVLAKLAELDVLRHIEVISCVSGGSILGAYYYLKLRDRLKRNKDSELKREDYIELVREMETEFLEGVQKNIRLRMLFGFISMLKVFRCRRHLTTHRLADLYESKLYSRVKDGQESERYLDDLTVQPAGFKEEWSREFNPKYDNWGRRNKVPVLILNATTLNTCHNWQFTATYMGEPPARATDNAVDANARLRRMYHDESPLYYRKHPIRLGDAVAASACVPVLFDPLVLDELYGVPAGSNRPESYVTRLVDGGNYDNQGVMSLIEQGCNVLLVSDATGQTGVEEDPGGERLKVLPRSNNILMARVRQAEYLILDTLSRSRVLRSYLYVHLKKGLEAGTIDWNECQDPTYSPKPKETRTEHGIRRDIQRLLSGVRTDLDSFSNAEADALMLSGYRMVEYYLPRAGTGLPLAQGGTGKWRFLQIAPVAEASDESDAVKALRKTLQAAASLAWKPYLVSAPLKWIGLILFAALAVSGGLFLFHHPLGDILPSQQTLDRWGTTSIGMILVVVAVVGGALWGLKLLLARLHYRVGHLTLLSSILFCIPAQVLLSLHLWLIEPIYLKSGPKYRV